MFNKITLSKEETDFQLEYYNSIGLLFRNQLFLNKNNKVVEFTIPEIKSIYFKKERDLNQNYIIFIIACALFTFSLYFITQDVMQQKIGILLSAAIVLYALLKKTYSYSIVLFTNYSHIFSIPVNPQDKEDACELIARTKRKVRTNKKYMQAS